MNAVLTFSAAAIAAAGLRAGWRAIFGSGPPLQWSQDGRTGLTPAQATEVVLQAFQRSPFHAAVVQVRDLRAVFRRGDWTMRKVLVPHDWHAVPLLVGVGFFSDGPATRLHALFRAAGGVKFNDTTRAWFRECAAIDFNYLVERMEAYAQLLHGRVEARPAEELADAYVDLGLKAGAPWPDVQAAYRTACKKHHPDRLSGRKLPPHVVEAAVSKFKKFTAAYQLLRRHLAQP